MVDHGQQENGGYCLPSVLFARSLVSRKGKGAFVETVFKKMYEFCDAHAE